MNVENLCPRSLMSWEKGSKQGRVSTEAATTKEEVLVKVLELKLAAPSSIHRIAADLVVVTTKTKVEIVSSRERNVTRWSSSS